MIIQIRKTGAWLIRYWLISTVIAFVVLTAYTSLPIFGQSPEATPNIQTVPKPEEVFTPTNTPFPTATSVIDIPAEPEIPQVPTPEPTRARSPGDNQGGGSGGAATDEDNSNSGSQPDQPAVAPTAPPVDGPLTGTVLVAVLNLRKGPSTGDAIIDTLFRNDHVQILARNGDGSWWLVCCGSDAKKPGWVPAQLLQPDFDPAQANARLPMAAAASAAPAVTGATSLTNTVPLTASQGITLQLQMRPSPAFAWQGQQVNVQFVVTNRGTTPALNVRLRDDLTTTLQYGKAVVTNNGRLQQQSKTAGGSIFSVTWPQLAAGESVTATVTLRIATDVPNGSLIDNLAVVAADNVADVPAGITLAMPPTMMPQFK